MNEIRFFQVDVFTRVAGAGNPLGVVIGADRWSTARMQSFAAWVNLVETTFLLRSERPEASYQLRVFTPQREIAFAGHPSLGSAHVALQSGFAAAVNHELVQDCQAGMLPIQSRSMPSGEALFVRVPGAAVLATQPQHRPLLAAALADRKLGKLAPAFVEGGRRWWLAELRDESEVRSWQAPHSAIKQLADATESLGLCVFARCSGNDYQLVVRAFPAGVGIVEDPASGAANGLIAAYLHAVDRDVDWAKGYVVSQGRELGRDARLLAQIDEHGEVWIGGHSVTVIEGSLHWPEPASADT